MENRMVILKMKTDSRLNTWKCYIVIIVDNLSLVLQFLSYVPYFDVQCILCLCLIIHNGFGQSVPINLICFVFLYVQIIRSGYYLYIVQSVLSFVNTKIVVDVPLLQYVIGQ